MTEQNFMLLQAGNMVHDIYSVSHISLMYEISLFVLCACSYCATCNGTKTRLMGTHTHGLEAISPWQIKGVHAVNETTGGWKVIHCVVHLQFTLIILRGYQNHNLVEGLIWAWLGGGGTRKLGEHRNGDWSKDTEAGLLLRPCWVELSLLLSYSVAMAYRYVAVWSF